MPPAVLPLNAGGWSRRKMCEAKPSCKNFDHAVAGSPIWLGCLESFLHQFGPVDFRFAHHRVQQIELGEPAEKRENHRLDSQVMSFRAERIAPRFKEMRCGQIPTRKRGSLVFVIAEPDYIGHLFLKLGPIDPGLAGRIERKRARRVEHRIRAEYKKLFDPAGRHVARELENAVIALIAMTLAQQNRASDIFQRGINSISQQLNDDWLLRPGQNQARTRFRNQIVCRFI